MENDQLSDNLSFVATPVEKEDNFDKTSDDEPLISNANDIKRSHQSTQNINSSIFTVDKAAIPALENDALEPVLCQLPGVTTFAQSTYEKGVISQLEKAINHKTLLNSDDNDTENEHKLDIDIEDCDNTDNTLTEDDDVNNLLPKQGNSNNYENKEFENNVLYETESECSNDYDHDDTKNDPTYKVDDSDLDIADGPDYQQVNEDFFDDDVDRIEQAPETAELSNWSKRKRKWSSSVLNIEKTQISSSKSKAPVTLGDDGDENLYRRRLTEYRLQLAEANLTEAEYNQLITVSGTDEQLQIPKRIWDRLFAHQQECLRWLWTHHNNGAGGGIIGDEMGLGKTIQVIAFLIALKHSHLSGSPSAQLPVNYRSLGPVLLVCPGTVMANWVNELHKWWPPFRVAVLHSTSTYGGADRRKLIKNVFAAGVPSRTGDSNGYKGSILITSYSSVSLYIDQLVNYHWHYVILDEGHKIRNPEAQVTIHCKQFKTPHRLILSGSPIQNNLRELWSLFDFIYPLKLGTLRDFTADIAEPIRRGGYVGATDLQIKIAYKCTVKLRAVIQPYLLRRTKEDVKLALNLPAKTEQVLFCRLTERQRKLYLKYLGTDIVRKISRGDERVFAALINIRKICNHPFLFNRKASANSTHSLASSSFSTKSSYDKEFFTQSGKMAVVHALLKLWSKQQHKVLFFTQSRQMLDIVERYVQLREYSYLRMDGTTAMGARQRLISQFNTDPEVFIFLLTTKVGGLGVNLTGANRVLIYDPDWNPCTDMQARERCWRIGQRQDVIIYRLLTAGTVEEKIYHRQIYKQYLTNSVLKDPNHRRFFKINDLKELFTLNDFNETAELFSEAQTKLSEKKGKKEKIKGVYSKQKNLDQMIVRKDCGKLPKIRKLDETNKTDSTRTFDDIEKPKTIAEKSSTSATISEQKRKELQEKARLLSKKLSEKFNQKNETESSSNFTETCNNSASNKCSITKHTKPKKGIKCEGKRIKELVGREDYYSDNNESEKTNLNFKKNKKSKKDKKKEDYLLRGLLGDALESVLQHEKIENVTTPDHYYLETEAERIASEAIEKMQQHDSNTSSPETLPDNREAISLPTISTNRQVNTSALAKLAAKRNSNVITQTMGKNEKTSTSSSSSLIALVKANAAKQNFCVAGDNFAKSSSTSAIPSTSNSKISQSKLSDSGSALLANASSKSAAKSSKTNVHDSYSSPEQLLQKLRDFLRYHSKETPNRATTNEILSHFGDRIPPQSCAIFKAMLKRICNRRQTEGGIVIWHLKAEFRDSVDNERSA